MSAATAVELIGRVARSRVERVGDIAAFIADTARSAWDVRTWATEAVIQARRLGVDSLPIGIFIAMFTGIVLALLASYSFTPRDRKPHSRRRTRSGLPTSRGHGIAIGSLVEVLRCQRTRLPSRSAAMAVFECATGKRS